MHTALRLQGFIAGIVYLTFAVGSFILKMAKYASSVLDETINTLYPVVVSKSTWLDCLKVKHESSGAWLNPSKITRMRDFCNKTSSKNPMFYPENDFIDIDFAWFVLAYFLWTALAHFFYITFYWNHYYEIIDQNDKPLRLRWIEYGVSASIMMILIAYFCGVVDLIMLFYISLISMIVIIMPYFTNNKALIILGGLFYTFVWIYIFTIAFSSVDDVANLPWFVYLILFGEAFLYKLYVILYILTKKKMLSFFVIETSHNVLSMITKLLLGFTLIFFIF